MNVFEEAARRRFPPLVGALRNQLAQIAAGSVTWTPCAARLRSGEWHECVYVAEAEPWFIEWAIWPDEDAGKHPLDVREVAEFRESTKRLPAGIARRLYEDGESGMGYTLFVLKFRDGSSASYVTGNAVDFIDYPDGQSAATVADVIPHAGRDDPALRHGLDYYWCLFSNDQALSTVSTVRLPLV